MTFGEYIRKLRKEQGKSLRQVAKQVGITHAYIAQLESGKFSPPADPVVLALAEELGEDPDILMVIAGRLSDGLIATIQKHPFEFVEIIRRLKGAPKEHLDRVAREIRDGKW
jgi:transcriptional regulator with XRE-family HTH domain